ncbi:MAG: hypothetical protein ACJAYU_001450 [Bradymonadia bacterium]|jgi:hypothetical protein
MFIRTPTTIAPLPMLISCAEGINDSAEPAFDREGAAEVTFLAF